MAKLSKPDLDAWTAVAETVANQLKNAIEGQEIYVASVANSFVPYSHLTKAFHVHEAVLILCRAGFGSEALALSRVILEMYITLHWITNQDQSKRAEDFAFFVAKRKAHIAENMTKYDPGSPVTAEVVNVVATTYEKYAKKYGRYTFWLDKPANLKALAEEDEILYGTIAPPNNNLVFLYDFFYTMLSDHVYVTALALDAAFPTFGQPYKMTKGDEPGLVRDAVFYATQFLLYLVIRVDAYREIGISDEIREAIKPFDKFITEYLLK